MEYVFTAVDCVKGLGGTEIRHPHRPRGCVEQRYSRIVRVRLKNNAQAALQTKGVVIHTYQLNRSRCMARSAPTSTIPSYRPWFSLTDT